MNGEPILSVDSAVRRYSGNSSISSLLLNLEYGVSFYSISEEE
jgi:hypothetical protein